MKKTYQHPELSVMITSQSLPIALSLPIAESPQDELFGDVKEDLLLDLNLFP